MATRFSVNEEITEAEHALWWANVRRSIEGKRGQAVLAELEAALLALPAPRLIAGAVCEEGDYCPIAALALKRKMDAGADFVTASTDLRNEREGGEYEDTMDLGDELGLASPLAWYIAFHNDEEIFAATPEARYTAMLAWVREQRRKVA